MINLQMPVPPTTYPRWDVVYSKGDYLGVMIGVQAVVPAVPIIPKDATEVARITRQPDPLARPMVAKVSYSVVFEIEAPATDRFAEIHVPGNYRPIVAGLGFVIAVDPDGAPHMFTPEVLS